MAPLTQSVGSRIAFGVLAVHLVVLPALYFAMVYLVTESNEHMYVDSVRTHARTTADSLERLGSSATRKEIAEILDSVILSGNGIFSELATDDWRITSSLVQSGADAEFLEDFEFGEHDDDIDAISLSIP